MVVAIRYKMCYITNMGNHRAKAAALQIFNEG